MIAQRSIFGMQNPDFLIHVTLLINACVRELTAESTGTGTQLADPTIQT